jgi:hypothetical protein
VYRALRESNESINQSILRDINDRLAVVSDNIPHHH